MSVERETVASMFERGQKYWGCRFFRFGTRYEFFSPEVAGVVGADACQRNEITGHGSTAGFRAGYPGKGFLCFAETCHLVSTLRVGTCLDRVFGGHVVIPTQMA